MKFIKKRKPKQNAHPVVYIHAVMRLCTFNHNSATVDPGLDVIGGIKPVCHDRHKTVPEFIFILLSDVDENHISTFTDVKFARTLCLSMTF